MLSDSTRPTAIWDTVLTAAKLHCDEDIFLNMIVPARLDNYDSVEESVVIQVPRNVGKQRFMREALPALEKAFANALGVAPRIYLEEADIGLAAPKAVPANQAVRPDGQAVLAAGIDANPELNRPAGNARALNPAYTFSTFVVGPSNRLALAAAQAVAANPGKAYNPLFIHGGVGLGKTHLLQATCRAILDKHPDTKMRYLSCEQFVNDFVDSLGAGKQAQFRKAFRGIDLLVIDDIHFLSAKEATQEEFFHTFNDLYNAGKQIIISSDSPPKDIPAIEERLTSRFLSGLPVRIEAPATETREAIITAKAVSRGVKLPRDVVEFIAQTITSNVRELEGAVIQVAAMASILGAPISLVVAREALKDLITINAARRVSIDDIVEAVCAHFGVRLADLQSARRTRGVTVPRQIAMYLAKKLTQKTLNEIGGYFGGRDHTTVLHSVRKIDEESGKDRDLSARLALIEKELAKISAG